MSKQDKLRYWLYCKSHGIILGSANRGIPYLIGEDKVRGHYLWSKDAFEWEFAELYYEVAPSSDLVDELLS